ncbi:ArnT family glycosyltransferase [Rehaibacterium terrae]|uniref:ArnT family glycosyltransferase n=1 Tax=Rehaibacterium terrae TaxID=1341696 RepID=UPI00391C902E
MARPSAYVKFVTLWALLGAVKLWLAASLDLFGDEAFYAWEARHPAWAYSDLPAGTAWLAWLGMELGGPTPLGLRWPFLLMGAAIPWLLARIAARWFGAEAGWRAGILCLLMPLTGTLGVLALPDVPLTFATLLCLDAIAALLRGRERGAYALLAAGLVLGALSHYRFVVVLAAGLVGLLLVAEGRALLRRPALWGVLALGAAAWLPLGAWNLAHRGAGVGFQLVDRHPWAFHWDGAWFPLVQAVVVTPLLFVLLLWALVQVWRRWRRGEAGPWGLVLGAAGVPLLGLFVLGFFADAERVSFHWPLPAWLALMAVLPALGDGARSWSWSWRAAHGLAAAGLLATFVWLAAAAMPTWRSPLADRPLYPDNFSGWRELAVAVAHELDRLSPSTQVVADNFMPAAALAFHLRRRDIGVLDHPKNHKHGRAAQLALWGYVRDSLRERPAPVLLVLEDGAVRPRELVDWYRQVCVLAGPLPPPVTVAVDDGRKRFLLFRLPAGAVPADAPCVTPALGAIDRPGQRVPRGDALVFEGWTMKDGAGVRRVEVLLGGEPVAEAMLGLPRPDVVDFWRGSTDPAQPDLGFRAELPAGSLAPGRYRLALRVHGGDGSVEVVGARWLRVD